VALPLGEGSSTSDSRKREPSPVLREQSACCRTRGTWRPAHVSARSQGLPSETALPTPHRTPIRGSGLQEQGRISPRGITQPSRLVNASSGMFKCSPSNPTRASEGRLNVLSWVRHNFQSRSSPSINDVMRCQISVAPYHRPVLKGSI